MSAPRRDAGPGPATEAPARTAAGQRAAGVAEVVGVAALPWADLQWRLAARVGGLPPVVVPLGTTDALGARPERVRAAATVHLTAATVLVGPWGGSGPAPCGQCLAIRWQRLRTKSERDALETGSARLAAGRWPALPDWAVDAVAAVHARLDKHPTPASDPHLHGRPDAGAGHDRRPDLGAAVAGRPDPGAEHGVRPEPRTDSEGRAPAGLAYVTEIDLETLAVRTATLLAEPLCPSCAVPAADLPFGLEPGTKPDPGTYRLRPAGSYPLPIPALANPVCGALGAGTWLDVTSPTTAPVAGTVFMRGYAGLNDVTWSGQANSYAASRELAFLEGLERYAGTHRRRPAPPLVAAYDELGDSALDPRTCGGYAPETYATDPAVSPFDPARPIPWVRGHSLHDGRPILVPARLVHYSAGVAADNFVFECSNGCATGSSLAEAALFGLLELVERDAFLLGWYGGARLTEIDLDTVPVGAVRTMRQRAELLGYDVHAFDNRVDLAAPVVTALAVRRDGGVGTLAFAAASSLDPAAAVEGAVCEILTYIPHLPRQVRERPAELAAMARDFDLVRRLPDHAALYGLPEMAVHAAGYLTPSSVDPFPDVYAGWESRRPRTLELLDDLGCVLDDLSAAGLQAIVVDQTAPEQERMGLRTVCTLVPGLLPIDFGWSRQRALTMPRLRTAHRRGGHRPDDLTDAELHRVPHPFP